jgi:hypothetical protein
MRRISAALQSRPWCARRDGTAHSFRQQGRRYCLRRRAIDSGPFLSLVTGRASRSWSALHQPGWQPFQIEVSAWPIPQGCAYLSGAYLLTFRFIADSLPRLLSISY